MIVAILVVLIRGFKYQRRLVYAIIVFDLASALHKRVQSRAAKQVGKEERQKEDGFPRSKLICTVPTRM